MKVISKFHEALLHHLNTSDYVLLDPIPLKEQAKRVDILFEEKNIKSLIDQLTQSSDLNSITLASSFKSSKAVLKFKDNAEMIITFVHKFAHRSLVYLDESELMLKRVKEQDGIYIPCIEHLFEHRILKSFLELKGIGRATFQYFNELHILVQEDLLEYFNMKYGTSFSSMYQLTDFDEMQRTQMLKQLNSIPSNRFIKKVNVRWHNFLGTIRQARII